MDFVSPVLDLIGYLLLLEYARINGLSDKLEAWGKKLIEIQAVMDSAEERQMNGDPAAGQWLSDLREVAYDMEDLLEQFSVDAKGNSSEVQALSRSSKLPNCLIACYAWCDPRSPISKMKEMDRRLKAVFRDIPNLGLVRNPRSGSSSTANLRRPRFITTSLPEPKFVGRENQMEELLTRLTRSGTTDDSVRPFTVVSIVGMGGLGKTTLAVELYNYEYLNMAGFTVKAWACVSDVFDMVAVTKSILDQVAPTSSGGENNLTQLQNSLKAALYKKKFFIVLDDVWNDNYDQLESLISPLYSGSTGSRVLLTTRNIEVARLIGDRDPFWLDFLSLEECLSLLAHHSIGERSFESRPHLQDIAVRLVTRCKGLPLSIKTIGGLLRFECDDEKWKEVLAHGIWERQGNVPPALKLSYLHLPKHLKRCFAACALFPRDYTFNQDEVIQLWITQGLLNKGTAKTYHEVGLENLIRLEALSLIQKDRGVKVMYSIHDLVNDLAKSVAAGTYFSSDEYKEGSSYEESFVKVRHAAMVVQNYENCDSRKFNVYRSMKEMRTFMTFQIATLSNPNVYVAQEVIHQLIMNMKNLRILCLRYFNLREVPDQIGELKFLRSVDLSHTNIEVMPESICNLVELQFLLLRGCPRLRKLPGDIYKLTNLLHLDVTDANNLEEMPPNVEVLRNLEILDTFFVGKEVGQELKQLGPLKCLQRELHLRNLQNVNDVEDAKIANISEKERILELSFHWGSSSKTSQVEDDHQLKLLDLLQPPRRIESLSICGYRGKIFPSWFGSPCMNNVVSITLKSCISVNLLPPFGQLPLLEKLDISGLNAISSIGVEFYGTERPFRSLRSLSFNNMVGWEEWSSHGDYQPFPCLCELKVKKCPKLCGWKQVPSELTNLEIRGCGDLEKLPEDLSGLTSLNEIIIVDCWNLSSLPDAGLPHSLRRVELRGCLSLPPSQFISRRLAESLEELILDNPEEFGSITDLAVGGSLFRSLRLLSIRGHGSFGTLLDNLQHLPTLSELILEDCSASEDDQFHALPCNLSRFELIECPMVKYLPDMEHLMSLKTLRLQRCESIMSFPSGGLPPNLEYLSMEGCQKLNQPMEEWGLRGLTALRELRIMGGMECVDEMECFPPPSPYPSDDDASSWGRLLPPSLVTLSISTMNKLERVDKGLRDHLPSLQTLWIVGCPMMKWLPDDGLPDSLEHLAIPLCPLLKQRCSNPSGEYWPFIQFIPRLDIL